MLDVTFPFGRGRRSRRREASSGQRRVVAAIVTLHGVVFDIFVFRPRKPQPGPEFIKL
jgi:hypothetical protein